MRTTGAPHVHLRVHRVACRARDLAHDRSLDPASALRHEDLPTVGSTDDRPVIAFVSVASRARGSTAIESRQKLAVAVTTGSRTDCTAPCRARKLRRCASSQPSDLLAAKQTGLRVAQHERRPLVLTGRIPSSLDRNRTTSDSRWRFSACCGPRPPCFRLSDPRGRPYRESRLAGRAQAALRNCGPRVVPGQSSPMGEALRR